MTIEVPSRVIALTDSAPVSATTSTGSPRCSVSTCLSRSCLLGGKIEANSIEATNCCNANIFSCVTSLNTTWHLIFESIPEVVRPLSLITPPIGARPSSQGCQASSLALHSIGMVWPKQHGLATPSDMQSLLLRPPSIGNCRSARCSPSCLSDGKRPRLLYYPTFGMTTRATRVFHSG